MPAILYELTYKLCYMYSNWQGPVKVPSPLKYAEKLSQITSKTIRSGLNDKMKINPVFI
jgi:argonaute-like protein implicated in RNA metabolism and viral defense